MDLCKYTQYICRIEYSLYVRSFISKCVCVVYIVSEVLHIASIQCVHSNPDSVCVSLWIIQDSNRHRLDVLWLFSNICVCVQSIVWPVLHTCSARLDTKPTHTDKYLDFKSTHPIAHKLAVTRTLNHRARNLPSTPTAITDEERKVKQALEMNGYPKHLIQSSPKPSPQPSQDNTTSDTTFVTILYIKNTSETIGLILAPLGIKTTFQPINTLGQLIDHPKDPVPKENRTGVSYCSLPGPMQCNVRPSTIHIPICI